MYTPTRLDVPHADDGPLAGCDEVLERLVVQRHHHGVLVRDGFRGLRLVLLLHHAEVVGGQNQMLQLLVEEGGRQRKGPQPDDPVSDVLHPRLVLQVEYVDGFLLVHAQHVVPFDVHHHVDDRPRVTLY